MSRIEQTKDYTGKDLESIFFRPMLCGPDASELGIKIMYNTPTPTTLHFWKRAGDILQKYTKSGWLGGTAAAKFQKTIEMARVKAEVGYSADDYFNMVYELISARADVNMNDLSGSELETAETALFKEAIAESIRATMWLGDTTRVGDTAKFNTFDGFIKKIKTDAAIDKSEITSVVITPTNTGEQILKNMWNAASPILKEFKTQNNLVFLVTSDVFASYEEGLDNVLLESAYMAKQNGRTALSYKGIPVIDIQISSYLAEFSDLPKSLAILTDKRNLALAVNTNDFPGTEVKMWYNPDLMENRQRAIFMAGCDYLLPELVVYAAKA